jgi:hypothetical protein
VPRPISIKRHPTAPVGVCFTAVNLGSRLAVWGVRLAVDLVNLVTRNLSFGLTALVS